MDCKDVGAQPAFRAARQDHLLVGHDRAPRQARMPRTGFAFMTLLSP
jgi:hypothetical protein